MHENIQNANESNRSVVSMMLIRYKDTFFFLFSQIFFVFLFAIQLHLFKNDTNCSD